MRAMRAACGLLTLVIAVGCGQDRQVPKSEKAESIEITKESFPHAIWDGVLKAHNSGGFVDYAALLKDREDLDAYLASLAKASPKANPELFPTREDKLAYYINAYNALVFQNVCAHWPLEELGSLPAQAEFFVGDTFVLGGERINLKDLENEVIRPTFEDARAHFALNCASFGCPRLPEEAFVPARVDEQLDRESRIFVAEERNVKVDSGAKTITLSMIFKWYREDFVPEGGGDKDLIAWINRYRPEDAQVPYDESWDVEYRDYDWRTNRPENAPKAGGTPGQ